MKSRNHNKFINVSDKNYIFNSDNNVSNSKDKNNINKKKKLSSKKKLKSFSTQTVGKFNLHNILKNNLSRNIIRGPNSFNYLEELKRNRMLKNSDNKSNKSISLEIFNSEDEDLNLKNQVCL